MTKKSHSESSHKSQHKSQAKTKTRTPKTLSDLTRILILFLAGLCVVVAAWIAFYGICGKNLKH